MTKLYVAADQALAVLTPNPRGWECSLELARRRARCVAVDPRRSERVYCGTFGGGVWRSDDAGGNWRPAGEGITHPDVLSVAVSSSERVRNIGVVYAGIEPSAVFRSEDGGHSWVEGNGMNELPSAGRWSFPPRPETHHVRWIHPDPHAGGRLYVAIEAGALIRSPDGGKSWTDRVPDGPIDTHQLATHSSAPGRLYSAAGDGYFESADAGDSWQPHEDGLRHTYAWSVAVDSGDPDTILLSSAASARHSHRKADAESFIYRRTAKASWVVVGDGLPEPTGRRTAVLAADPGERGSFYAVWESDVFRSVDGGVSWDRMDIPWPAGFEMNEPRALAVTPD